MVRCGSVSVRMTWLARGPVGSCLPDRRTDPLARTFREPDRPGPNPRARIRRTGPIAVQTLYVVVNPPPRYEIVGLLQQRSYTPVNEFFGNLTRGAARIACWEAAREGSQKYCW